MGIGAGSGRHLLEPGAPGGAPAEGEPQILAEVASAPLDSLASEINRRSLNLGAELLLQWAGGREGAPERLTKHVQRVIGPTDGVYLADGSGLSYDDRVAPSAFISYLAKFPGDGRGAELPAAAARQRHRHPSPAQHRLPRRGRGPRQDRHPGPGLDRGGLPRHPDGVLLVSLMYNGPRPWAARQAQWKLFRELGANGVVIPADSPAPPVQLGGDRRPPAGWRTVSLADSAGDPAARSREVMRRGGLRPRTIAQRPRLLRLTRTGGHSTTPPTSAMPASSGGIGTVSLSSAVASIGPTSSTFSFRVKENPPRANPDDADDDQDDPDDRARLHTGRRPWITRIRTMASATTSRMWMNPPSV